MRFNNSNIVFNKILNSEVETGYEVASYKGVAKKTLFYLLMVLIGAFGGFGIGILNFQFYLTLVIISGVFTFIFSLISFLSVRACKVTGSIYCLMEGCLVGGVSGLVASVTQGLVSIALLSTIAVFAVVTLLFVSNIVKVNNKFMKFLIIFAISFLLSQVAFWIISMFVQIEYNYGLILLVSSLTVFLATLYLFFDLERIRQVVEGGYPKQLEWYVAFGLAFTLIWLYFEILRLVVIIFGNRN